jgi:hypothetical protein
MTSCAECGANTLASRNITLLIDTVSPPWLTGVALRLVSFRSGSAWLGRSQKDGLLPAAEESLAVQGHRLALEGQRPCFPFSNRDRAWPRLTMRRSYGAAVRSARKVQVTRGLLSSLSQRF